MEKFIPYEKLSKKQQKALNRQQRTTWGSLNPVTRKPKNSKAYNRAGTKKRNDDFPDFRPCFFQLSNRFSKIEETLARLVSPP